MKNLILLLTCCSIFVGCGVEVNSNDSRSDLNDNGIRYTISKVDDWDETLTELTTSCIDLNDTSEKGQVEIDDDDVSDMIYFSWDVDFDEVTFKVNTDRKVLSRLSYDTDHFEFNEVNQTIRTREGVKFLLEIKEDRFCF